MSGDDERESKWFGRQSQIVARLNSIIDRREASRRIGLDGRRDMRSEGPALSSVRIADGRRRLVAEVNQARIREEGKYKRRRDARCFVYDRENEDVVAGSRQTRKACR